jgi:hypothetical protein
MSGNFSRYSHQPDRRYTRVTPYQGAMASDADQVEAADIARRNDETLGDLAIGSGVPQVDGILAYATTSGPPDIIRVTQVIPGRVLADGRWGVLRLRTGTTLGTGALDILARQADFILSPTAPATGDFLVCADIFDVHVGPAADDRLTDPAFLAAETAARQERLTQIKLIPLTALPSTGAARAVEQGLPRWGDLRLAAVALSATVATADPCDPCAALVDTDDGPSGNDHVRVEIHSSPYDRATIGAGGVTCLSPESGSGATGRVMVKFSRDNASVEIPAEGRALLIADSAYATAVFELSGPDSEQQLGLAAHTPVARAGRLMDLAGLTALTNAESAGRIIRVWDGACSIDLRQPALAPQPVGTLGITGTITRGATWDLRLRLLDLDLRFAASPAAGQVPFVLPGDAWSIDLREYAASTADQIAFRPDPVETHHAYTFLGRWTSGAFAAETAATDMRSRRFPPLTRLDAQSVGWSNHHHPAIATNTVQGAIDLLFARPTGGSCLCTVCLDPTLPLDDQINDLDGKLPPEGGRICLPAGTYTLSGQATLSGRGEIILDGAGAGLVRIEVGSDGALEIADCDRVTLKGLTIAQTDTNGQPPVVIGQCDHVTVRTCAFSGPAGPDPEPAPPLPMLAIQSVRASDLSPVIVSDCTFFVQAHRVGLRIDGASRRSVTGCHFTGTPPKRQGKNPVIGSFTVSSRMERRPSDFVEDDERGLFAMAGNPDFVLNLSAVPAAARPSVAKWLRRAPELLGLKSPQSPEDWRETETTLTRVAEVILAKSRPRGRVSMVEDARTVAGTIGLTPGPGTSIPPNDGPDIPIFDLPDPSRPDLIDIEINGDIVQLDPDRLENIFDVLDDFEVQASGWLYQRNFGLWTSGDSVRDTLVADNHFRFVHSAIVLRHDADDPTPGWLLPASKTTVRDNQILRAPIIGPTKSFVDEKGTPLPYAAGITIENGGYLTLSHNAVQQMPGSRNSAEEYLSYLPEGPQQPTDEGYTAILLRGNPGPVIHVTGNDATYFRFCVIIEGDGRWQDIPVQPPEFRQNVWTFRDNTVLPCIEESTQILPIGFIPGPQTLNRRGFVRIGLDWWDYNHPGEPRPKS